MQIGGADGFDAVGAEERLDLAHLAGIVAGDDQHTAPRQSHASACFCNSTSSPMPLRARRSNCASSSSLNGAPSAVPWISTKPPAPVSTKFASVSAVESSL